MKAPIFWFRITIGDHLRRVHRLTRLQRGALNDLILYYFDKGCLPVDDASLARVCEMTQREWRANRDEIKRAGEFMDDWRADWVEAEFAGIENRKERAANARAKLAEKRAAQSPQPKDNHSGITDTVLASEMPLPSPSPSPSPLQKEAPREGSDLYPGRASPLGVELNGSGRGSTREADGLGGIPDFDEFMRH